MSTGLREDSTFKQRGVPDILLGSLVQKAFCHLRSPASNRVEEVQRVGWDGFALNVLIVIYKVILVVVVTQRTMYS